MSQVAHQAEAYPGFTGMSRLGLFLLPLNGMLGFPPALNSPGPIYAPRWSEAL